jgi:hypothetical protein
VKSVTIAINDLFEFEGQPVPEQRPEAAAIEEMACRQFEFLRQPLQIEIGERMVTLTISEESSKASDEAARLTERAAKRTAEGIKHNVFPRNNPLRTCRRRFIIKCRGVTRWDPCSQDVWADQFLLFAL